MSVIIDLASRRKQQASGSSVVHPAGVRLPFDQPSDSELVAPEVRQAVSSGSFEADIIALLESAVSSGDRVLIIGAGLGVLSTLVARMPEVERVIAVEADAAIAPYTQRVHAANGVPWVETVNAVLTGNGAGRAPFFSRRDLRASSLVPEDGAWRHVMLVPMMDLNLMLTEERISLVIHNLPQSPVRLLSHAALGSVERILVAYADTADAEDPDGLPALTGRGFGAMRSGSAVLFERGAAGTAGIGRRSLPANAS
jgi:hypothetical protein